MIQKIRKISQYFSVEMADDDQEEQAKAFGEWLRERRGRLSRSRFCQAAGISISTLVGLEEGGRMLRGQWIMSTPSTRILLGIAEALDEDPRVVFEAAGIPAPKEMGRRLREMKEPERRPAALSGKIDRLTPAQRAKIEALVDEMLPAEETQ